MLRSVCATSITAVTKLSFQGSGKVVKAWHPLSTAPAGGPWPAPLATAPGTDLISVPWVFQDITLFGCPTWELSTMGTGGFITTVILLNAQNRR